MAETETRPRRHPPETETLAIFVETRPRRDVGTSRDWDVETESTTLSSSSSSSSSSQNHNFTEHKLKLKNTVTKIDVRLRALHHPHVTLYQTHSNYTFFSETAESFSYFFILNTSRPSTLEVVDLSAIYKFSLYCYYYYYYYFCPMV